MADEKKPEIWFPAKRYGWGWGLPITWQGWVVMLGWLLLFFAGALLLVPIGPFWHLVFTLVMVVVLVAVCYAKGEPPRWRWGDDGRG